MAGSRVVLVVVVVVVMFPCENDATPFPPASTSHRIIGGGRGERDEGTFYVVNNVCAAIFGWCLAYNNVSGEDDVWAKRGWANVLDGADRIAALCSHAVGRSGAAEVAARVRSIMVFAGLENDGKIDIFHLELFAHTESSRTRRLCMQLDVRICSTLE